MKGIISKLSGIALAVAIFGALAGPALAISAITNDLQIDNRAACVGQTVDIKAQTYFDNIYIPNPYPTDYAFAINANYLSQPSIYYRYNEPNDKYIVYRSSEGAIYNDPAWWYQNAPIVIVTPAWHRIYMTARVTKSNWSNGWNWVGQAMPGGSWGGPSMVQMSSYC